MQDISMEKRMIIKKLADEEGYDEEDEPELFSIAKALQDNIGFKDERSDSRYIVKFPYIWFFAPDGMQEDKELCETFSREFDMFCTCQADEVEGEIRWAPKEGYIMQVWQMLSSHTCGNYRAFLVYIPEITEDNLVELTFEIFCECGDRGAEYINTYVHMVEMLKDLEDTYMDRWISFITENRNLPEACIGEITRKYNEYKLQHKG